MSVDLLIEKILQKKNPTVAGLDARPEYLPPELLKKHTDSRGETLEAAAGACLEFNKALLDVWADVIPAVKPQSAFYEMLGPAGMETLRQTLDYARRLGYYVITDAKRGDIGSTSEAYSSAFLGEVKVGGSVLSAFPSDALTVNPYLGSDNLKPFLADCEKYGKMIFVLCKTSNPSSFEVQELVTERGPVYRVIASLCESAGEALVGAHGYSSVGIVVGATHPAQLAELREEHPSLFFLVPGFGAQGGGAKDVAGAFDKNGLGAVVNNSRGLICAWQKAAGKSFKDASRAAAIEMREELRKVMGL
jgi:orotidine-5'-phosphate decarboxylase